MGLGLFLSVPWAAAGAPGLLPTSVLQGAASTGILKFKSEFQTCHSIAPEVLSKRARSPRPPAPALCPKYLPHALWVSVLSEICWDCFPAPKAFPGHTAHPSLWSLGSRNKLVVYIPAFPISSRGRGLSCLLLFLPSSAGG